MSVSRETMDKLKTYEALLHKWQKAVNLISPNTLDEAWERHFEDSLQVLPVILSASEESRDPSAAPQNDKKRKVLFDLGSGGGFPGMVTAITQPDLSVHLVESDSKKCSFLKTVSRETSTPVTIHNERIESLKTNAVPDIITARALASLDKLFDWCAPWAAANPALTLIFLKGEKAEEEIAIAQKRFSFSPEIFPSKTNPQASILRITNLRKLDGQP